MDTPPLFSIITITRNNLSALKKTKASITSQSYKNFEWMVIDGASNDGTKDWLSQNNVPHISEPDTGIYDAMNKGIEQTSSPYMIFMNAGDEFSSASILETITHHIKNSDPDFIYGDALEILEGQEIYKPARPHEVLLTGMITHHQSMIYKRSCLDGLRYNLKYKIAADYDFTLRFLETAKEITYIPVPLCVFESGGVSQTNALQGRIEQFKIRRELKTSLRENIKTFFLQSLAYGVRCLSPRFYWWLKELSTKI